MDVLAYLIGQIAQLAESPWNMPYTCLLTEFKVLVSH